MKTGLIEERDILSVLGVGEVEKRVGKVPDVECTTIISAAGNAAVRYDEIRQVTAPLMGPTIFREGCHD